jgi:hypothetical protein
MQTKAEDILRKGLQSGYAGSGKRISVQRGPFTLAAEELTFPDLDAKYNDHWIAKRVGGGQEIAQGGEDMATRVFAGGIVKPEILTSLGITEQDVLLYLKRILPTVADRTRLYTDVTSEADGDWKYQYIVTRTFPDVPLTLGVETILYKSQEVFVHVFLIAPIV